jgi:hypothetical protein
LTSQHRLDGGGTPGPGGPSGDAPDDEAANDDDVPRPVATRPPGVPAPPSAAATMLAVRGLRVPAHVALVTAREEGIEASFVPRPGSLVAVVRLVARRLVAVRAGRRAVAHVRADGLRRGAYEVSVRAGAGRATLGPPVVARVRGRLTARRWRRAKGGARSARRRAQLSCVFFDG